MVIKSGSRAVFLPRPKTFVDLLKRCIGLIVNSSLPALQNRSQKVAGVLVSTYPDLVRPSKLPNNARQWLPLPPAVLHLLLLLREGERHAYFLQREIARRTNGTVALGNGSLYGAIRRMLASGLIEESAHRPEAHLDHQQRRYYRLTHKGNTVLQADLKRIRFVLASASGQVQGDGSISLISTSLSDPTKGDHD